MPVPEAGIAHHVLPSHPSFAGLIGDLPGAELLSRFLGGSFILNSFGGLLNRPATPGAYLHRWHRDLRAFSASDDIWLMINMLIKSEEHTSELSSLMRISYAVLCLKKKNNKNPTTH